MRARRWGFLLILALVTSLVGVRIFNPLPSLTDRTVSTFYRDTAGTALGRALAPRVEAHSGASGITPLASGHDAFAARVLLARAAERSIDVQYYIWNGDLR